MRPVNRWFLGNLVLCLMGSPLVGQTASPALPAPPNGLAPKLPASSRPLTYGTSVVSYVRVPAVAFTPDSSSCSYNGDLAFRYGSSCLGTLFYAPLDLPSGAKIASLEWDFFDGNASYTMYASLLTFDRFGGNPTYHPAAGAGPQDCLTPGYLCSGIAYAGGANSQSADLSPDNITVDKVNNQYVLYVFTYATDGSQSTSGIIVGYVLQVSPDPAYATFADVPVGHPFHRFVEALYASGITAGCGGGNFCPDQALTRGQMAVFLSVALGLQWP